MPIVSMCPSASASIVPIQPAECPHMPSIHVPKMGLYVPIDSGFTSAVWLSCEVAVELGVQFSGVSKMCAWQARVVPLRQDLTESVHESFRSFLDQRAMEATKGDQSVICSSIGGRLEGMRNICTDSRTVNSCMISPAVKHHLIRTRISRKGMHARCISTQTQSKKRCRPSAVVSSLCVPLILHVRALLSFVRRCAVPIFAS